MPLQQVIQQIDADYAACSGVVAEPDHPDIAYAIREQRDLTVALATVWHLHRSEMFHAEYEVVAIEPEIRTVLYENEHYKVVLMLRPDAIIARKSDGALMQWELKTKQSINNNWLKSWEHNLQLIGQQLGIMQYAKDNGLQDRLVVGAYIEALIKGKRAKDDATGMWRQESPLIYAYIRCGDGLMIADQISPTWKKGWPKSLVSDFMPVEQWVYELSREISCVKAVVAPPISPSEHDLASAARQWGESVIQEHEHAAAVQQDPALLDKWFPQNTEMCFQFGPCRFLDACWSPSIGEDPIGSGLFRVRQPNHPEVVEE